MINRTTVLAAACLASALAVGCSHDQDSSSTPPMKSSTTMGPSMRGDGSSTGRPLEGNPGATTNQTSGYPASDAGGFHPQTDDTRQYRPAPPAAVQPTTNP